MAGAPILLVDDSAVSLNLMRLLLTYEGFEVRTAERAEDALQMLDSFQPALVLTDIRMPGMDGVEMTRRIKSNWRTSDIRVAALTNSTSGLDMERALAAGCEDCIVKSENTARLAARVRMLIGEEPSAKPPSPAKPAAGAAVPQAESSDPYSASLRRRLLEQARQCSVGMLKSLDTRVDPVGLWTQLHEWARDTALGSSMVNRLATCAEELLAEAPLPIKALRECLSDLYFTFDDLLGQESAPPAGFTVHALRGKRIALVALPERACDAICAALVRVEARPLLFSGTEALNWPSIGDCDLIMLHIPAALKSARPEGLAASAGKLVLAGECRDLLEAVSAMPLADAEFLAGSWKPEEVLMRLALAGTRSAASRPKTATQQAAQVRSRDHSASPSVILADDDPIILAILRTMLTNHGMRCQTASNGREAMRLIREVQPDAAVLDIDMPEANGLEVLSGIRRENLPTMVMMLSAHQKEAEVLRSFRLGADDYLVKPFNPLELTARLKRLLRQGGLHFEQSPEASGPTN